MSSLKAVEGEVISLWEDLAEDRGFNRVFGRILYTLLIDGAPISQQEIAEKTGYSIPTVSRTLNTLVSLGSVRKTRRPGSRLTLYYMEMQPQDLLIGGLRKWVLSAQTMERRLSTMRVTLRDVEGEDSERAKRLEDLLTKLSESIPKMIKIMEKTIEEIGEIL